jgi:flagellar motility protein MotE (MotC chaperone)
MYAGYFVAMLLLAAYLTGVLQQGILPRFSGHAAAVQQGEQSADEDRQSTVPESDQVHKPEAATEDQVASQPPAEQPSVQPAPQKAATSASQPPQQNAASMAATPAPAGDQRSVHSDEEKALAEKRAELLRLEEQIRKRKDENRIEERWLAELKASSRQLIKERDARREAGVKRLAKLYEGMEPEAAASILSKLKREMATEVLAAMKDRQASKVLAAMNGQKAKELSERLEDTRLEDQAADPAKVAEAAR